MAKKGQASTEYLIILAVVVIVALAVVGVLGGFPMLAKGISEKDSAAYWQSADIGLVRYFANSTGTYAVIRNNRAFGITLTYGSGYGSSVTGSSTYLAPGMQTSGFMRLANSSTTGASCASAGSGTFSLNSTSLSFGYSDPLYSTNYNFTGLKPLVGAC